MLVPTGAKVAVGVVGIYFNLLFKECNRKRKDADKLKQCQLSTMFKSPHLLSGGGVVYSVSSSSGICADGAYLHRRLVSAVKI